MKITIERDACCAADDAIGPLDIIIDRPESTTLQSLCEKIVKSRFLQFSSTSNITYGYASGRLLVSISGSSYGRDKIVYFVNKDESVKTLIPDGTLKFQWDES